MRGDTRWYWMGEDSDIDADFSFTAAHEIGHEILKLYSGDEYYSYKHKGSSTLTDTLPVEKGGEVYPTTGEIDLMKYYNDDPKWADFPRIAAAEPDVLGLVWLSKLKVHAA